MAINSVQQMLLGIPVDFYVTVNMAGIKEIVDVVVTSLWRARLTFTQNEYYFVQGTNQLDGEGSIGICTHALWDPAADTGRQGRQTTAGHRGCHPQTGDTW